MQFPTDIHVVDFEGSRVSGIVEVGVVTLHAGEVAAAWGRACAPVGRLRASEIEVHGLDAAALAGAEPFSADWGRWVALRRTGVFAAHQASTESGLLRAVWPHPPAVPVPLEPGREEAEWGPWLDTLVLTRRILPRGAPGALERLVPALGLGPALVREAARWCPPDRRRFHAALFDALAASLVLRRLAAVAGWDPARLLALGASGASARRRSAQRELL